MTGPLSSIGIQNIYHYAPVHYLPFIARTKKLLSKSQLRNLGFSEHHFRRTSFRQDQKRGFDEYIHLTLDEYPNILSAKLSRGFPHLKVSISVDDIESTEFHLCRYNIAKSRYLKNGKKSPPESPATGRYYHNKTLPIAITTSEKTDLLAANYPKKMIEVLVPQCLVLSKWTAIELFHEQDLELIGRICEAIPVEWAIKLCPVNYRYNREFKYAIAVEKFIANALKDPYWKGNGLDYDKI